MLESAYGDLPRKLHERRWGPLRRGAETLFEAVALAIAEFRDDKTIASQPGPMTDFMVRVIRKPIDHVIKLKRVQEWAQFSNTTSPAELIRRERVRKMLEAKAS